MESKLRTVGKKLLRVAAAVMVLIVLAPPAAHGAANPPGITVNQVLTTSDGAEIFTYRLKPLETGVPMPAGSTEEGYTFTITGTGSVTIELPGFSRQGIYRYELFQVISGEKTGYVYDKQVYTVEAHVGVTLDVQIVIIHMDGVKAEEITFQNAEKNVPSDPDRMVDPLVRKTVFGSSNLGVTFEFRLAAENPSNPMPPGSINGVKTISITGSGWNAFGVWSYDEAGTYYYTVYEVDAGVKGYTYDTAVYTITDMVKAENGELVLTRVVTNNANKPVTSFIFNNYYSSGGGSGGGGTYTSQIDPPATNPPPANLPGLIETTDEVTPLGTMSPSGDGEDGGVGPKTGDDSDVEFYIGLFAAGGLISLLAAIYLIAGGKWERGWRQA